MADPFTADVQAVNKLGFPTSYLEDYMYQVTHIEEGSPAASSLGEPGEFRRDSDYLYVCYAIDSWGRILLDKAY